MNRYLIWSLLVMLSMTKLMQTQAAETSNDRTTLKGITDRVRAGDSGALSEVAQMPAAVAVPYLEFWTHSNPGRTTQQNEAAVSALKNVQGYAEYIREDMQQASSQGNVPLRDFALLKAIGTSEAEQVVAPYLFDLQTVIPPHGDLLGESSCVTALNSLEGMNLPGAPTSSPQMSDSDYLKSWQKWAIAKGLVPRNWSGRIGAPDWMLKLEAFEKSGAEARAVKSLHLNQSVRPSVPVTAEATPSASVPVPQQTPQAVATETLTPQQQVPQPKSTEMPSVLLAIGVLVVVIVLAVFLVRHKSSKP